MRLLLTGAALSVLAVCAYVAGVVIPYPGRSFSIAALMIGVTLTAIGRATAEEGPT